MGRAAARERLGFPADDAIVLFVGRFSPLKGIERLLAAVPHVQEQRRVRLVIIGGNGDHTPESRHLQRLSEAYGIRHMVTFAGRIAQEHLPPYYSAADMLVLPSYYESFGLVALESLACGTPVVGTPVGVMPDILREGMNGCVVEDGSPRALARGIEGVLGSAPLFSAEAIRGSVLRFGWQHVAAATMEQYGTTLNCRGVDSAAFVAATETARREHAWASPCIWTPGGSHRFQVRGIQCAWRERAKDCSKGA
jgi:D-inositol-3-phosphate glycosyltransferase